MSELMDVFFYGLYMDPEQLAAKGVSPRRGRLGVLSGYELITGQVATLRRNGRRKAWGMVYALTTAEMNRLYLQAGLTMYEQTEVEVQVGNSALRCLCAVAADPALAEPHNPAYAGHLIETMRRLQLPSEAVSSVPITHSAPDITQPE